jgi:hypothetical protein
MNNHLFLVLMLGSAMTLIGCATSETAPEPQVEIRRIPRLDHQPPLIIKLDGSRASVALAERADAILAIDRQLAHWRQHVTGNPEVIQRLEEIALETRAEAIRELDKAWTIASSTSGPIDVLFGRADDSIKDVNAVLNSEVPNSPSCRTEITALPEDAYIHYTTEGDYQDGAPDWISYTFGEYMNLGRYRFLVSKGDDYRYDQKVMILTDPKIVRLQPAPGLP